MKREYIRFMFGPEKGINSKIDKPYWNGLRVATIGGLLAFAGGAIVALGAVGLGKIIVVLGILIGLVGLIYHFVLMVKWFSQRKTEEAEKVTKDN